jgi:transcriptional regulator of acetoin/glycerol metabolism
MAPTTSSDEVSGEMSGALPENLAHMPYREAKQHALTIFDEAYFTALLRRTGGNISEAARQAGLDRSNFRRASKRSGRKLTS